MATRMLRQLPSAMRMSAFVMIPAMVIVCVSSVISSPQETLINPGLPVEIVLAHSGFDSNDEDWRIVDVPDYGPYTNITSPIAPTHHTDMGTSGGCVSSTDPNGVTFYWQAPTAFLGNKLPAYGGALTFDLRSEGSNDWEDADVVLISGSNVLVYDIPGNPVPEWVNYRVPLREGDWKVGALDGPTAPGSLVRAVLANLATLLIRGEYSYGSDNCFLDEVSLLQYDGLTSQDISIDPGSAYRGAFDSIKVSYALSGPNSYYGPLEPDALGMAQIGALQPGTYDLALSGSPWLRRVITGVQVGAGGTVNVALSSGDADGDGKVNLFDFVVLDLNFGKVNAMADLDGDGQVNLFDYVIIDTNFGAQAD